MIKLLKDAIEYYKHEGQTPLETRKEHFQELEQYVDERMKELLVDIRSVKEK